MGFLREQSTILSRYLAASGFCLLFDMLLFEILAAHGMQPLLARLAALLPATALLYMGARRHVFGGKPVPKPDKGQGIPFGLLCVAGAALSFTIFARILPLMPQPPETAGQLAALLAGGVACLACNYFLLHSMLPASEKRGGRGIRPRAAWTAAVWGLFALAAFSSALMPGHLRAVFAFPALEIPLEPSSPDAWLRLAQVRQWLQGGDFFDHTVYNTGAPGDVVATHWTRPMDALVALFHFLTPARPGTDVRLMLAAAWLPLVLCAGLFYLVSSAARESFNSVHARACAGTLVLFSVYHYATPGDVDHHLLLAVLWSGAIFLLLKRSLCALQAFGLGAVAGVMIWTSPEALFFAGLVFALLGLEALFRPERARTLFFAAVGAAVTITAALFVEMPADKALAAARYDAVSVVHAALLGLTAAAGGLMAVLFRLKLSIAARIAVAALCGGAALLGQFLLFPEFYRGPLAEIDPSVLQDLLATVNEAKPLFAREPALVLQVLMAPLLAAFLITAAALQKKLRPARKRKLALLSALLGACFLMTLVQVRWGHYLQPVAVIACAALLPGIAVAARGDAGRWLRTAPGWARPYAVLLCVYLLTGIAARHLPAEGPPKSWCMPQLRYVIQTGQLQAALKGADIIYVPADAGGEMLFFTPFRIIAGNYHRESRGLRDMALIAAAQTAWEAKPVLKKRKADALFFCPGSRAYPQASWLRKTEQGALPGWLERVEGLRLMDLPGDKPLLLRVREDKF